MLTVSSYTVEKIRDPFGILTGERYEFVLEIEVEEDDELFSENGIYVRVIYLVDENRTSVVKHEVLERSTNNHLDFEMEDEELAWIEAFCKEHVAEAGKN
ncbi:hypothetical protein Back11_20970 [Paenibacillus baekrokdamisoli]|uniref:Uncharacterized protein n=1 Tax=Paenibacillus baekrokdamisoli TaxID=1712516 RepID=A0A3G9IR45_9BACL|nr:DUF6509 family protein [Paenibacillus baekrokdamisoli]MBB3069895.1 hypothetical protein [Paenibacillus baekrokdamisoli]BBH20752.1 hypothetical protein Back11_20970 [Paenibacillus baekrokdamisoli]